MATRSVKPMVQDGFDYREMTDTEFAQYEIDQAQVVQDLLVAQQKIELKNSAIEKLNLLGLTEGEISAIFA